MFGTIKQMAIRRKAGIVARNAARKEGTASPEGAVQEVGIADSWLLSVGAQIVGHH